MSTVMVFGVFDLFHPGHEHFLKAAMARGTRLVVVVARDSTVSRLKRIKPADCEERRLENVRAFLRQEDAALLGDEDLGRYSAVREIRPDVICFGHDQEALRTDLQSRGELQGWTATTTDAWMPDVWSSTQVAKRLGIRR